MHTFNWSDCEGSHMFQLRKLAIIGLQISYKPRSQVEVSGQNHAPAALPSGKNPRDPFNNKKIRCPCRDLNPGQGELN